jgi:uncharacterized protein (TIGR02996 family)
MRTFVSQDEKSNKFWNIELKGKSFTIQFGRVGTAGQTQVKDFPDEAKAKKEHDKLVAEKTGKGYVETTPGGAAATPPPAAAAAPEAPAAKPKVEKPKAEKAKAAAPAAAAPVAAAPSAPAGRRTFRYQDDKSDKFWAIEQQGSSFTVTFGKTGTAGQTQRKDFPDEARARKEYDKLIAEKTAKGYIEKTAATAPSQPAAPNPALRQALESALVEKPDDLAAHSAYADFLTEQGDPRGEFIQTQLALERPDLPADERRRLRQRERKLLAAHARTWLGGLAEEVLGPPDDPVEDSEDAPCSYRFARGWLERIVLRRDYSIDLPEALAQAPEVRLLRELVLEYDEHSWRGGGRSLAATEVLARSPFLTNIRVFRLGEEVEDDWEEFHGTQSEHVVDLVAALPCLEELHLLVNSYDPARLFELPNLTHLRVLRLYHLEGRHPLEKLAANPALANLTHLLIHPHGQEVEDEPPRSFLDLAGVRALRSPHLGNLTHLRLRLSDLGDEGIREIIASGILKRLKVLDLRHGCVTDAGARLLADCPDVRRLERLDLDRNGLTRAGVRLLKGLGISVRANDQQTPDELEERVFFTEGDVE